MAGDAFQPHLQWGVKASFVGYIASLADGRIEASNGVWQVGNALAFPVHPAVDVPDNEIWFNGRVSFSGHGGMMKLVLNEPRIENQGESIFLTIDTPEGRTAIAELTETGVSHAMGMTRTRFSAVVTEDGSKMFNGQYPAGQAMEEVEVTLRG
ncbi:HtaA domain-containing protein [Glutamicibacter soli]|uniref:HtaA domain-containing protein n=1 Tax=Glutamicibacter soli TaxID=453836 RepID=UPI003FD247DA